MSKRTAKDRYLLRSTRFEKLVHGSKKKSEAEVETEKEPTVEDVETKDNIESKRSETKSDYETDSDSDVLTQLSKANAAKMRSQLSKMKAI